MLSEAVQLCVAAAIQLVSGVVTGARQETSLVFAATVFGTVCSPVGSSVSAKKSSVAPCGCVKAGSSREGGGR